MYLWLHDGRAAAGRAGDGLQQRGEHDLGDDQGRIIGGVVLERARLLRAGLVRRAGVVGAEVVGEAGPQDTFGPLGLQPAPARLFLVE